MIVEQISVFLENKTGRLLEVTKALAEANINIRALSLADTSDFGILRLIVDDIDRAKTMLRDKGFTVSRTNVVAVAVDDKPGGLDRILSILHDENINVEYMYAFVQSEAVNATLIFRFDHVESAIAALQRHGIPIIPVSQLCR